MRIYLSRTDVTMAKHRLDTTDIGTVHQKVGGEAVTHGMRANMFSDPS